MEETTPFLTHMDDQAAFLRMIAASPEDNVPRLVFADWLQEHGDDDRAEFIREQIRLHHLSQDDPEHPSLRAKVRAMLDEHRREWVEDLPEWARKSARFERGFVREISGTAQEWLDDARTLLERFPIRVVSLREVTGHLHKLAAQRELLNLTVLDLRFNHIGDEGVDILAGSEYLQNLHTLHLWYNNIGDVGANMLARSPWLKNLRVLSLGGNEITDRGAEALAASPYLNNLEQLVLYDNLIIASGRYALYRQFKDAVLLEESDEE